MPWGCIALRINKPALHAGVLRGSSIVCLAEYQKAPASNTSTTLFTNDAMPIKATAVTKEGLAVSDAAGAAANRLEPRILLASKDGSTWPQGPNRDPPQQNTSQ